MTQLSELVTAVLAVGCALLLGSLLSDLPQATLGSMVVVAVLGLIKPSELVRFWKLGRTEFWVAVITAVSGLCFGLLVAVAVGVGLTLFLVLYELDHVGVTELQATSDRRDVQVAGEQTAPIDGLLILRFDGPQYTANVRSADRRVLAAVDAADPTTLVLDTSAVVALPVTVLDQFGDLRRELEHRGVALWIAALPPRALETARQTPEWAVADAAGHVFATSLAAVRAYVGAT